MQNGFQETLWIGSHGLRSCCQNPGTCVPEPLRPCGRELRTPKNTWYNEPEDITCLLWPGTCPPSAPSIYNALIFQASWPLLRLSPLPRMFFPRFFLDHYCRSTYFQINITSVGNPPWYSTWSFIFRSFPLFPSKIWPPPTETHGVIFQPMSFPRLSCMFCEGGAPPVWPNQGSFPGTQEVPK